MKKLILLNIKQLMLFLALMVSFSFRAGAEEGNPSFNQLADQVRTPAPPAPRAVEPAIDTALSRDAGGGYWVTVKAADSRARTRLLEAGLDIVEIKGENSSGFADQHTLELLSSRGYPVANKMTMAEYTASKWRGFPVADAAYHDYKETTVLLKSLAAGNPDIASLFSIGKTSEGRDIWCLRINSNARWETPSSKPGAFFLGNLHAREHLTNEVPLLLAAWLLDHKNSSDVKKYIDTLDIYIVPMANPDGVEYNIKTGRYIHHRKNMSVNQDKSLGVDLNRNFDSWWCEAGASDYPGSDSYCGPKVFSEPESRALKRFMEARKNLKTLISYHSYSSEILYPWGGSDADVPVRDKAVFEKLGAEMGKLTGYVSHKSSEMYIATGDLCDWAYAAGGIFAFTFELEGDGFYPGSFIIDSAAARNIKAAVYLLGVTDNPYDI